MEVSRQFVWNVFSEFLIRFRRFS